MGDMGKKAMEKIEFEWQKEILKLRKEKAPEDMPEFEAWQWNKFWKEKKLQVIKDLSETYASGVSSGKVTQKTHKDLQREWALLNWWRILVERDEI